MRKDNDDDDEGQDEDEAELASISSQLQVHFSSSIICFYVSLGFLVLVLLLFPLECGSLITSCISYHDRT